MEKYPLDMVHQDDKSKSLSEVRAEDIAGIDKQESNGTQKRLGRRAKLWLVAVAVGAVVGLHASVDSWYSSRQSQPHLASPLSPVVANAPDNFDWYALEPSTDIQWTPCFDGHQCARLILPLDYMSPSNGLTTTIALRMLPARTRGTSAYRGTVLINPGGPGGSGTDLVERVGQNISRIIGDEFDVLGFDPRGVGASTPNADCFPTYGQRPIWQSQLGHQFLNVSDETLGLYRARIRLVGERCEDKVGGKEGIARFMSTASVARDMLEITQKMGQDKLQYWGFSYGSILGQYFSAMYPDKVGRVVIDGVYDSHNYRAALWSSNLADIEAVMDSLFTYCHQAGPFKCALHESTPAKIRARYFRVIDQVSQDPVAISHADPPLVLTSTVLINQLFRAAYKPLALYGNVIATIRAIETANQTALAELAPKIQEPTECKCSSSEAGKYEPWLRGDNDAFSAIACGDGDEHPYDAAEYAAVYDKLVRDSPHAGPIWSVHWLQCAEWRVRPKWRYTGPLDTLSRNTSHPLLLVSPRFDPVCPLRDALAVRERYPGAGLLVQNSHGHCSISSPSLCTARHIREYFVNGSLPKEGTICEVDELPFVGAVKDVRTLSSEAQELLDAMKGLQAVVPMFGYPL